MGGGGESQGQVGEQTSRLVQGESPVGVVGVRGVGQEAAGHACSRGLITHSTSRQPAPSLPQPNTHLPYGSVPAGCRGAGPGVQGSWVQGVGGEIVFEARTGKEFEGVGGAGGAGDEAGGDRREKGQGADAEAGQLNDEQVCIA